MRKKVDAEAVSLIGGGDCVGGEGGRPRGFNGIRFGTGGRVWLSSGSGEQGGGGMWQLKVSLDMGRECSMLRRDERGGEDRVWEDFICYFQ